MSEKVIVYPKSEQEFNLLMGYWNSLGYEWAEAAGSVPGKLDWKYWQRRSAEYKIGYYINKENSNRIAHHEPEFLRDKFNYKILSVDQFLKEKTMSEKIAIWTKTKEEHMQLREYWHSLGYKWGEKEDLLDTSKSHLTYESIKGACGEVCLTFEQCTNHVGVSYGGKKRCEENGYKVIPSIEYLAGKLEPTTCPECKGTGLYVGFTTTEPCRACCGRRN